MIRRLVGLVAFVAAGTAVPVAATPVHSSSPANTPCLDNVGITIVVDFHELGGGVNIRCASGPVTSGLDALDKAAIVWESVRRFPGFVCRIAGLPGPDREACINTPPATAYWSYWVAPRGGTWCYSTRGPGARVPPPGTVEGWSFVLGRTGADIPPPGIQPPPPIDGAAPAPLSAADCGTPPGSPSPVTTTAAAVVQPPPTTVTTATPVQPESPPATSVDVASQSGAAPTTPKPAASASTTVAAAAASSDTSTTTSTVLTATTTPTSVPESTVASVGDSTESTSPTGTAASAVALGTVDLSDDGRGSGGFGPATAIGIVAAAGLVGAGVYAARRRRALT